MTDQHAIHPAFALDSTTSIPELPGTAYAMHHATANTPLLYLETDDEEMGFAIAFRTPPADNTGVFHILEHSVLCGSDKYPVKDPFVHLLKSSMKTFLNAATSSDFTVFPVASTNEKDLANLMSVYLDAVFHPAILHEPRILEQEGWHYERDGEEIVVNGVVYNEMKGLLAKPGVAIANALEEELFPDTAYRFEPGGIPGEIEELDYGRFIDSCKRHYTPENAAIVLYGKMNLDAILPIIDEQLLSAFVTADTRAAGKPNPRNAQAPVVSTDRKVHMNALPQDAEIRFGSVFADTSDTRRARAMSILGRALLGSSEAPLRRMLIDTGIAADFSCGARNAGKRYFIVSARNAKPDSAEAFLEALKDCCHELLSEGLSKELLEAALFGVEFDKRTGGGNGRPPASDQMMDCLQQWGAGNPLNADALRYNADFDFLRDAVQTDYYDDLLREAVLENDHYAVVELCPTGDAHSHDSASGQPRPASPNPDELERIDREAAALKAFQDAPESPEALAALPKLDRADCLEAPHYAGYRQIEEPGLSVLRHEYAEDGIAHIIRYYDISSLSLEDYHYLGLLIWLISETDTLRHDAAEVIRLKHGRLGLINSSTILGTDHRDGSLCAYVWVYTCSLSSDMEFNSDYVDEILHETVYEDRNKLRETIEIYSQMRKAIAFETAPHMVAETRAGAHITSSAALSDASMGIEGFRFIQKLKERCADDAEADKVLRRLEIMAVRVFGSRPALVSFSGDDEAYARFIGAELSIADAYEARTAETLANLTEEERTYADGPALSEVEPLPAGDEAFAIPGDVAYCARAIDVSGTPSFESGQWRIANKAASLDYLWNAVRVKGGAYGVGFSAGRTEAATFNSFRDPNADTTLASFDGLAGWLSGFSPTDDELNGYVISAAASFDKPVKGFRHLLSQGRSHLLGWTLEDRKRERREAVSCTADDVRRLGRELSECAGAQSTVVIGSRALLEQSERPFDIVELG